MRALLGVCKFVLGNRVRCILEDQVLILHLHSATKKITQERWITVSATAFLSFAVVQLTDPNSEITLEGDALPVVPLPVS